jgi:glycosyltransferase involved in cell wall biosynthesis
VNLDLFDPSKVTQESKEGHRKALNISADSFVLGYIGSIGTWYKLPEMLDYFKKLKEKKPSAIFLFVTGESPGSILDLATKKGIDQNDIRITSVLHHQVPEMISLMDSSIFFIKPSYSKKASSPTKQGEIMAMGVPLICNSNIGDTDRIVHKYNSGVVINSFDDITYQNTIIEPTKFDSKHIIEGAGDYFSLEEGVRRYKSVYEYISE